MYIYFLSVQSILKFDHNSNFKIKKYKNKELVENKRTKEIKNSIRGY